MKLTRKLENLIGQWPDPYQYECSVCERSFQSERSTCPDCGGDVERVGKRDSETIADPNP